MSSTIASGIPPPERAVELARRVLACLDLTSLDDDDDPARVRALCARADTPFGPPAAVCVNAELVAIAREALDARGLHRVGVASVANFPDGSADIDRAARETRRALAAGADEIDVVFPWRSLLAGDAATCSDLLSRCRAVRGGRFLLKVILETGELRGRDLVRRASGIAIDAGADMLKTSTGKVDTGATTEAAETMLRLIRERGGRCGFKAAGGIRTLETAAQYLDLSDRIMDRGWSGPERFRIGASTLLDEILATLRAAPGAGGANLSTSS
jgi:deoxyribose-phosphate aldolase